ncbi:MAG: hypothetical protein FJ054_02965 [Cyanobacteria bacterium M_surface_10_m2_119]|nr:hypothetical protein [Cyanobacteria bacterium M_surface_10_m2_119]
MDDPLIVYSDVVEFTLIQRPLFGRFLLQAASITVFKPAFLLSASNFLQGFQRIAFISLFIS